MNITHVSRYLCLDVPVKHVKPRYPQLLLVTLPCCTRLTTATVFKVHLCSYVVRQLSQISNALNTIFSYQILGVLLALTTVVLDTQQRVLARPLSVVGTIMALFVYYPAKLYAKCLHSVANLVLNLYGWYQWLYGKRHKTTLYVSKTHPHTLWHLLWLSIFGTVVLGCLLDWYAHAHFPYWDSLHTVLCWNAQWMLVEKKLESWILWVVADVLYAVILYHKGLYLFSGLYVCYTFLAIYGYYSWWKIYCGSTKVVSTKCNT